MSASSSAPRSRDPAMNDAIAPIVADRRRPAPVGWMTGDGAGGGATPSPGEEAQGSGRGDGLLEELVLLLVVLAARVDAEPGVVSDRVRRLRRQPVRHGLGLERGGGGLGRVVLLAPAGQHLDAAGDDLRLPVARGPLSSSARRHRRTIATGARQATYRLIKPRRCTLSVRGRTGQAP